MLLHGFAQTAHTWDDVARALRIRGFAVYAPNLAADVVEAPCTMDRLCAGVARLVRACAKEHGAAPVLVGYSMGGRIAAEVLVREGMSARKADGADAPAPLPLSGLVLESAGLGPRGHAQRAELQQRNAQWASRVEAEGVEAFVDWWEGLDLFATQHNLPVETQARVRADRLAQSAGVLADLLEGAGQHHQSDQVETCAALQYAAGGFSSGKYGASSAHGLAGGCAAGRESRDAGGRVGEKAGRRPKGSGSGPLPVLYLAGALDEKYRAVAECLREQAPDVDVRIVPDAGHNIHLEQPNMFLQALLALCADVGEATSR